MGPAPRSERRPGRNSSGATRRSLALMVAPLLLAIITTGCIPIPRGYHKGREVLATGWSSDGRPVALAQKYAWSKVSWTIHPVDPDIDDEGTGFGELILIKENGEQALKLPRSEPRATPDVEFVQQLPGENAFLLRINSWSQGEQLEEWTVIDFDGNMRIIPLPEDFPALGWNRYVSTDLAAIRSVGPTDMTSGGTCYFCETNRETGEVKQLTDPLLITPIDPRYGFGENAASKPLESNGSTFAFTPDEQTLAVTKVGLVQIIGPDGLEEIELPFSGAYLRMWHSLPRWRRESIEDRTISTPGGYLDWSPDQRLLYVASTWGGSTGIISADGSGEVYQAPFIRYASWSPDGTKIAGADWEGNLVVWPVQLEPVAITDSPTEQPAGQ